MRNQFFSNEICFLRLIKLSSPKLNCVIGIGGLFCLAATVFVSADNRHGEVICMVSF